MQRLELHIIKKARKKKMKKLERSMRNELKGEGSGYLFVCPFCNYHSKKNPKGSAKIFDNDNSRSFKCFNCGKWRRL